MSSLIATLVFNTLIAGFLTALGFGGDFVINLVFSQCVGLSILGLIQVALHLPLKGIPRGAAVAAAIVGGAVAGGMLGRLLTGVGTAPDGSHEAQSLLIGLVFGSIAAVFFWLRERNATLERDLQARELAKLEAEKQGLAAQLRMLQAQIEPHFLFNSLANVAALIEADPKSAAQLLEALICYLRSSLTRTRADGGTLGDEVVLLKAYLDVLKIRMGVRLDYVFDVAPELLAVTFPPMLLQPLVENAVRHGLEPKVAGGRITISAQQQDQRLLISVADDGLGFSETPGEGIGVANIRARLAAIYGSAARLELSSKAGVIATMSIPVEASP
jgi:sensor histidine kinase YesM